MSDIVKEARELLEFRGLNVSQLREKREELETEQQAAEIIYNKKWRDNAGPDVIHHVSEEALAVCTIYDLIEQLDLCIWDRAGRLEQTEQERDAALERLRSFEKGVPIGTGSPETLLKLLDENRSLEQERDAALERVRVLSDAGQYVFDSYAPRDGLLNEIWGSLQGALNEVTPDA